MEGAKIKILVRQSNGDQVEVECEATSTIAEFKALVAEKQSTIVAAEMRLIFKGKILKDEMTIGDYNITDGLTVHLVKGGGAKPAATTASTASEPSSLTGAASAGGAATGAPLASGPGAAGGMPMGGMGGMPMFGGMGGMPPGMGMGGMGGPGGQMPNPD